MRVLFRILLSLYLILLAFAGPGLCYCNILQLTHRKVADRSGKNQSSDTKHKQHCNCKHQHDQRSAPVQPGHSNTSCPSCPCNHHEQIPVVLPSVDLTLSLCFDFAKELNVFENFHGPSNGAAQYLGDALLMAYLSGWHHCQFSALGILRAPFVLLC